MYSNAQYTGTDLPAKTLCLTYDDGPGKHTSEIANFLHDEHIQATFFVVGKYASHHQDILENLAAQGHLIGNHTYDHLDMPYHLSVNGDIINQVLRTDAVIKYVSNNMVYFRSPYGKWSSEIANILNSNILCAVNHIGPIHWDVGGVDCYYWKNGYSVEDTVNKYLGDINAKGKGIVVMHDEIADMNYLSENNNTLALTKQLIPLLKEQGYTFVRLDEIESVKKNAAAVFQFTLLGSKGFVCLGENDALRVDGGKNSTFNQLCIQDLGHGTIALRASNGLFFSLQPGTGNLIEAVSEEINDEETFDLIPLSSNQLLLRAYNGNYLTGDGGKLVASAAYMRGAEIFSFSLVGMEVKKNVSLSERYKALKRQFLYVKSKIQQGS